MCLFPVDTFECANHPILTAFLYAYNSHEDVILSPDDMHLLRSICQSEFGEINASRSEETSKSK